MFLIFAKISFLSTTSPHKTMFFVEFHPLFFLVKDKIMGTVLLKGACENDVYTLPDLLVQAFSKMVANVHERTSINGWHKRLGHPSQKIVHHLVKNFSLPIIQEEHSSHLCTSCSITKAHKQPFRINSLQSTSWFNLYWCLGSLKYNWYWWIMVLFDFGWSFYKVYLVLSNGNQISSKHDISSI